MDKQWFRQQGGCASSHSVCCSWAGHTHLLAVGLDLRSDLANEHISFLHSLWIIRHKASDPVRLSLWLFPFGKGLLFSHLNCYMVRYKLQWPLFHLLGKDCWKTESDRRSSQEMGEHLKTCQRLDPVMSAATNTSGCPLPSLIQSELYFSHLPMSDPK